MANVLTELDRYLFAGGVWRRAWERLGAHPQADGVRFAVWAPGAAAVSVCGAWNDWCQGADPLTAEPGDVWSGVVPGAAPGMLYKLAVRTAHGDTLFKSDPYAFWSELPPGAASRIAPVSCHRWQDGDWMAARQSRGPMNIYEVHPGSWKRHEDGSLYSWDELRRELVPYVRDMGYTHVEFLPLTEHPFDGSWGYQVTGYYSPTARFGEPDGLRRLVDALHQAGVGAILDWVPGHFCRNGNGLARFCGEKLYEAAEHLQWGTYRFDFSRPQVRSFLLSSGLYWLQEFHFDGLRLDGVTSLLDLNFGVGDGERRTNPYGGSEDLDARAFLRGLTDAAREMCPGVFLAAEESTAREDITQSTEQGGLGFDWKWNMGWMNDTLRFFSAPFGERPDLRRLVTFPLTYAFSQRFILPFSHDEVVHGKKTLLGRMPGDYNQQFAGLRLLALWQMVSPGRKLTFMGCEFAPYLEWRETESLEWFLLGYASHRSHQAYIRALNALYRREPALWDDGGWEGFFWLDCDGDFRVLSLCRRGGGTLLCAFFNFSDTPVTDYRPGMPRAGVWRQCFATREGFPPVRRTSRQPAMGRDRSIRLDLPPLSAVVYRYSKKTGDTDVH